MAHMALGHNAPNRTHVQLSSDRPSVPRVLNARRARHAKCPATGKLENVPLFADSALLGPSTSQVSRTSASVATTLEQVPLNSEVGIDYSVLRAYLSAKDFRKADDETRQLLINLAGPDAVKRNWVYFTEVKFLPLADLQTIDNLWKAGSNGKFGYSVQKELWLQSAKRWPKFFKQIDWTVGENNVYRKWPAEFLYSADAPKGHLPLTNALRGTQLFQALLEHPAFDKQKSVQSIDQRSKDAAKDTLKF